jgi:hypothetical protein
MMTSQCQGCGGFDKLDVCTHCTSVVCERCKPNHAPFCEELRKRKRRGEGPTIANAIIPEHRVGHIAPPAGPPDKRRTLSKHPALGAPYDLSATLPENSSTGGLWDYAEKMKSKPPLDAVLRQEYIPESSIEPPITIDPPLNLSAEPIPESSDHKLEIGPVKHIALPLSEGELTKVNADIARGLDGIKDLLAGESFDDMPNNPGADLE